MSQQIESINGIQFVGQYCQVTCKPVREIGNLFRWNADFESYSVGSESGTEEEQIAFFIAGLPDEQLLEGHTHLHEGQLFVHWVKLRDSCVEIAIGFLLPEFLQIPSNCEFVEKWKYRYRKLEVELYKSLWFLIKNHSSLLIPILRDNWDFPFESSLDLFKQIVREDIEGEFSCYLFDEYQYKANDIHEIAMLKRKNHKGQLTKEEENQLWELIDKHTAKAIWRERLILVANFLAKQQVVGVEEALKSHDAIIHKMSKLHIDRHRDSELNVYKQPSHYVRDGFYSRGVKPKWKA